MDKIATFEVVRTRHVPVFLWPTWFGDIVMKFINFYLYFSN